MCRKVVANARKCTAVTTAGESAGDCDDDVRVNGITCKQKASSSLTNAPNGLPKDIKNRECNKWKASPKNPIAVKNSCFLAFSSPNFGIDGLLMAH